MTFNESKFEVLRYSVSGVPRVFPYYAPDGNTIVESSFTKDLGVIMTVDAKFNRQIEHISSRARQQAGWILRVFETRAAKPMLTLYRALVLSFWSIAPNYGT